MCKFGIFGLKYVLYVIVLGIWDVGITVQFLGCNIQVELAVKVFHVLQEFGVDVGFGEHIFICTGSGFGFTSSSSGFTSSEFGFTSSEFGLAKFTGFTVVEFHFTDIEFHFMSVGFVFRIILYFGHFFGISIYSASFLDVGPVVVF